MKIYDVLIPNGDGEPIRKSVMAGDLETAKTHIIEYITGHNLDVDIDDVTFNERELKK